MNGKRALQCVLLGLGLAVVGGALAQEPFLRGDANSDGFVSISDEVTIQRHLFAGGRLTGCYDAADTNDDGAVNIRDQIEIVRLLVDPRADGWNAVLPEPYPLRGDDTTEDPLTCEKYSVTPAAFLDTEVVTIGEVSARAGDEVEIPIILTNTMDIDALQLVLDYDPPALTPTKVTLGPYFDRFADDSRFNPIRMLDTHPDRGILVVVIVSTLAYPGFEILPGRDTLIGTLHAQIQADAAPGTVTLRPNNGVEDEGVGPHRMRNELTHRGGALYISVIPRVRPGAIEIVNPDLLDFLRGDSNSDGEFNIADPIHTLSYLFLGGDRPLCADAADVIDDGTLDISDAVAALTVLFLGGRPERVPSTVGTCHRDETEDTLGRCEYNRCPGN